MGRPRTRSMLSFTGKSHRSSSGSIPKVKATETPEEKHRFKLNTKASDPSKAMNELQPSTLAQGENTMGNSIRTLEHRDADGNVIVDPDLSNPTRPRLQRPLDTIRAFEAAIDGSYNRRESLRAESTSPLSPQNRRSSSYQGFGTHQRSPVERGGYYGNRGGFSRPDSYTDNYGPPPNQYHSSNSRRFGPRNNSDPALYGQNENLNQGVYPSHGHQQSYDTVATATASNGSQWANSTDPSSENSSIDRVQLAPKPEPTENYGFNGFNQFQGPILEEHGQDSPAYGQPGYGKPQMMNGNGNGYPYQGNAGGPAVPSNGAPPPPPPKQSGPRVPIKLGSNPIGSRGPPVVDHDKRKSWLKRRFSKG